MFVSFRKCSRPQKSHPISDHNCQNLYPFSDQNGSKTIIFGAAHTYIPYIGEYPPGRLTQKMKLFVTIIAHFVHLTSEKPSTRTSRWLDSSVLEMRNRTAMGSQEDFFQPACLFATAKVVNTNHDTIYHSNR